MFFVQLIMEWMAPDGMGRAAGDLNALPPLPEVTTFAAKIEKNPHVARFAAGRAVADKQARLARAGRSPDITSQRGRAALGNVQRRAPCFCRACHERVHGRAMSGAPARSCSIT